MADAVVDVLRNELAELRSEVRELRSDVDKLKDCCSPNEASPQSKPLKVRVAAPGNFGAKFHQWNIKTIAKAPEVIPRPSGAMKGGKVYFNAGLTTKGGRYQSLVHCFDLEGEKWTTLPKSIQYYSSLAIIQDMVTLIGGKEDSNGRVTGDLTSFQESGKSGEWQQCLPPLPTPRFFTAAATYDNILIVAGGETTKQRVGTVEVLDMDTMQWTEASPLPEATCNPSMVIIGDTVYVLAGMKPKGNVYSRAAFSCSLTALVKSTPEDDDIWVPLPEIPLDATTAGVMCDTMVAIGGWTPGRTDPVKTIHAFSAEAKNWTVIGYLNKARGFPGVVQLDQGSKTLIVGGQISSPSYIDDVEIIEAKN